MTGEQKLALIIGFSLLLLVGVLISDHLARSRQVELDAVDASDIDPLGQDATSAWPELINPDRSQSMVWSASSDPRPAAGGESAEGGLAAATHAPPGPIDDLEAGDEPVPDSFAATLDLLRRRLDAAGSVALPPANGLVHVTPAPAGRASASKPNAADPATASVDRPHVVQRGETLYGIARRYYGEGSLWRALAAYNADRVGSNGSVRAGVTLRIPSQLEGRTILAPDPSAAPERRAAPGSSITLASYTVRAGDTLGEISQKLLGTSRRWPELLELNRDVVDRADRLPVGATLRIPVERSGPAETSPRTR